MNIPDNCSECPNTNICNAPYYGGSRCEYEEAINAKIVESFLNSQLE